MSALESALAELRACADTGSSAALLADECAALTAHINQLEAEHPAAWSDPADGTVYDLTATWRADDGAFWRHAGWVGLTGEPRVPLMLWSAVSQPVPGGIRRMSDLATLRAVIDDCGPLVALPAEASDESEAGS